MLTHTTPQANHQSLPRRRRRHPRPWKPRRHARGPARPIARDSRVLEAVLERHQRRGLGPRHVDRGVVPAGLPRAVAERARLLLQLREVGAHELLSGGELGDEVFVEEVANGAAVFLAVPFEFLEQGDQGVAVGGRDGEGVDGLDEHVDWARAFDAVVDGVGGVDGDVGHGHFAEDAADEVDVFPVFEEGYVWLLAFAVVAVGIGCDQDYFKVR